VSPASKLEATVVLKREALPQEPKEIPRGLAGIPMGEPPATSFQLRFSDSKGRYRSSIRATGTSRANGRSPRGCACLDRGEFIAQATLTAWKKNDPGKHANGRGVQESVGDSPGWIATRHPGGGRSPWTAAAGLYRLLAEGRMEEQPAVQASTCSPGRKEDQLAVTFASSRRK